MNQPRRLRTRAPSRFALSAALAAGIAIGYFVRDLAPGAGERVDAAAVIGAEPAFDDAAEALEERVRALLRRVATLEREAEAGRRALESEARALEQAKALSGRAALEEFRGLFELAEAQARQIQDWSWESQRYWEAVRSGAASPASSPPPALEERIRSALTPEQRALYDEHLRQKASSIAELAATAELARLPVTLGLDEAQKDEIYQRLYRLNHPEMQAPLLAELLASEDDGLRAADRRLAWAAEGVLTEDQREIFRERFAR